MTGLRSERTGYGNATRASRIALYVVVVASLFSSLPPARSEAQEARPEPKGLLSVEPRAWIDDATRNELKVIQFDRFYLRYQAHISNSHGIQVRDVLESRDGTVARMTSKEGRPLTQEEDAAERSRLQAMLDHPDAFAKHVKGDVSGKKMAVDMVKLMPEAMIYTYVPGQPQTGRPGPHAPEVVLDFKPDPKWNPPNMSSEALTGFQGRVWIDSDSHTMVRLDGEIFQGINFGFGMVAHIYPGGRVSLEQTNAGQQHWIFSHFVEHVTVRALMVKTLHENMEINSTDFRMVPSMSYQDAIRTLLEEPHPLISASDAAKLDAKSASAR